MPYLPSGARPHITAGIPLTKLASWIDDETDIPIQGPHTANRAQFGCTITKNFAVASTRSEFKLGMQGHLLDEMEKDGVKKFKIRIEGVTESWIIDPKMNQRVWIKSAWVPADCVEKGQP
jgi:hypothetical protein